MRILLLGSGGREHALAWKISQSMLCTQLYIAPGNAGTALCGQNVAIADNDIAGIKQFILEKRIDMLVVGPEQALVDGIYDAIKKDTSTQHVMVIGPSQAGARLEGSKDYAKEFMQEYHIPTAAYRTFSADEYEQSVAFLHTMQAPYVLKADGLAAGKGVIITEDILQAEKELHAMFLENKFGNSGHKVVIEQYLKGIELSVFVLTDGNSYLILPSAKDYKRIGEGDTGLNTGGMGSVSPVPFADEVFMQKVEDRIIKPTIQGIQQRGIIYHGFIFIGLMNVNGDPYVIEYNVRMGDPETESVMPRINNDLVELFLHTAHGSLHQDTINISDQCVASIMLVSGGYPEKYEKGKIISHCEAISDSRIFHAGTRRNEQGELLTAGGRVMTVTSMADTLEKALALSNKNAEIIQFDKKYYRKDIGLDVCK
ncbi:MAG: phosphoribosylamine--glycine ligase [Bacteroidales bacterium]|nr:phosphoribosylamine--glycine ligase [Bacteroidales bacterium]